MHLVATRDVSISPIAGNAVSHSPAGPVDPHREQPQIRPSRRPGAAAGRRLDPARRMERPRAAISRSSSPKPSPTVSRPERPHCGSAGAPAKPPPMLLALFNIARSPAARPRLDHHRPGDPELAVRLQRAQHQLAGPPRLRRGARPADRAALPADPRRSCPTSAGSISRRLVLLLLIQIVRHAAQRRRARTCVYPAA